MYPKSRNEALVPGATGNVSSQQEQTRAIANRILDELILFRIVSVEESWNIRNNSL